MQYLQPWKHKLNEGYVSELYEKKIKSCGRSILDEQMKEVEWRDWSGETISKVL